MICRLELRCWHEAYPFFSLYRKQSEQANAGKPEKVTADAPEADEYVPHIELVQTCQLTDNTCITRACKSKTQE